MIRLLVNFLAGLSNKLDCDRLYPHFFVLQTIERVFTPQSCTCTKQSIGSAKQTGKIQLNLKQENYHVRH